VALFPYGFTFTIAFITLLLELLNEAGRNLLLLNREALSIAFSALDKVFRSVGTRATAMWTDDLPVVGDVHVVANVQLLKRQTNFQFYRWSNLLLLPAPEEIAENVSEWVHTT